MRGMALAGLLCAAEIDATRGDFNAALTADEDALEANANNIRALALKAALLRSPGTTPRRLLQLRRSTRSIRWTCMGWRSSGWQRIRRKRGDAGDDGECTPRDGRLEVSADDWMRG